MHTKYRKVAVKIGSNVITGDDGQPDQRLMALLVHQMGKLQKQGTQTVLVSSGAVAAGKGVIQLPKKTDTIAQRQVYAALGQIELIGLYKKLFSNEGMACAQVLVTREDFRSRTHYLNMQHCLQALLSNGIVPVVNENDVVSVNELMFTDNDELAGLIAAMLDVDALFILTNVDGVYDGDPAAPHTALIRMWDRPESELTNMVVNRKSDFGRGGMITKCKNALKVASLGIDVHIASGKREGVLMDLLDENPPGTRFPANKSTSQLKKWVAQSHNFAKGAVHINVGAMDALFSPTATSLLPVGLIEVTGDFKKGDIIRICDEAGKDLGMGRAEYDAEKARKLLGKQKAKPIVHYDYLYLHT